MEKKNEATKTKKNGNAPIHTDKIGSVSASVFLNKTKDGIEFPSVVINRRYQAADKTWKNSNSYGAKALKQLKELVEALDTWLDANYPDAAE